MGTPGIFPGVGQSVPDMAPVFFVLAMGRICSCVPGMGRQRLCRTRVNRFLWRQLPGYGLQRSHGVLDMGRYHPHSLRRWVGVPRRQRQLGDLGYRSPWLDLLFRVPELRR